VEVNEATTVSLLGSFPSQVTVWFGDQPAEMVHHSANWIVAVAPVEETGGTVDLTLRSAALGAVLVVTDGFSYTEPTSPPASAGIPTAGAVAGANLAAAGADDLADTEDTVATSVATSAPSSTGDSEAPATSADDSQSEDMREDGSTTTTTTVPSGPERRDRAVVGDERALGGNLRGMALSGLDGVGDVPTCSSDPCRLRRLP
jgi:hypothetical protein